MRTQYLEKLPQTHCFTLKVMLETSKVLLHFLLEPCYLPGFLPGITRYGISSKRCPWYLFKFEALRYVTYWGWHLKPENHRFHDDFWRNIDYLVWSLLKAKSGDNPITPLSHALHDK